MDSSFRHSESFRAASDIRGGGLEEWCRMLTKQPRADAIQFQFMAYQSELGR